MSTSLLTPQPAEAPSRRRAQPVQITDRDRELLRFIAAHSFITVNHAQQFLGVSDTATYRRLQKLAGVGLLRQERIFHAQPGIYRITNGGLAVINSPLNKPSVDLRTYRHELNVPTLWLAAQRGVFGDRVTAVWTEREIKHHQRVGGYADRPCVGAPMFGVDRNGRERVHAPDLVIDHFSGACTAVELELSVKGSRRLMEIMEAYLYDYVLERVFYVTDQRQVAEAITRAAEGVGVSEKVTIVRTSLPLSTGVLGMAVPIALSGVAS